MTRGGTYQTDLRVINVWSSGDNGVPVGGLSIKGVTGQALREDISVNLFERELPYTGPQRLSRLKDIASSGMNCAFTSASSNGIVSFSQTVNKF